MDKSTEEYFEKERNDKKRADAIVAEWEKRKAMIEARRQTLLAMRFSLEDIKVVILSAKQDDISAGKAQALAQISQAMIEFNRYLKEVA